MLTTTLAELRKHTPCRDRLDALVAGLGEGWPEDREITALRVLDILGVDNVLWGLAHVAREHSEARRILQLFALGCAEHVERFAAPHVAACNRVTRRYLQGAGTAEELQAASAAAWAACAAGAAARAAREAREAAGAAATAAREAAWEAAGAAARAAWEAWQGPREEAAGAAARAAREAAWEAAGAAARAAREAERAWQTQWLRELLTKSR
jgi:hypothetical protein